MFHMAACINNTFHSHLPIYIKSRLIIAGWNMNFLKILISAFFVTALSTIISVMTPSGEAHAAYLGWCETTDDKISLTSSSVSPNPIYLGESTNLTANFYAKSHGSGYYSFSSNSSSTYRYAARTAYNIYPNWLGTAGSNFSFTMYTHRTSGKKKGQVDSCTVSKYVSKQVTRVGPQKVNITRSPVIDGNHYPWNSDVTFGFQVTRAGGDGYPWRTIGGQVKFKVNDMVYSASVNSNGYASANVATKNLFFSTGNTSCGSGSWVACRSTYWNRGTGSPYIASDLNHWNGVNIMKDIEYVPSGVSTYFQGDTNSKTTRVILDSPKQVSDGSLWSTALSNNSSGSMANGLSKAGITSYYAKMWDPSDEYRYSIEGSTGTWRILERLDSGAYSWYVVPATSATTQEDQRRGNYTAYLVNCEPEGGGKIRYSWYDYGQSGYFSDSSYNAMMINKNKTFNLKPASEGAFDGDWAYDGPPKLLGIDLSYDDWDIYKKFPSIGLRQNWPGSSVLGCDYPASPWVGSHQITISQPGTQYDAKVGKHIYSTDMTVSLNLLRVEKPAPQQWARLLKASPVYVYVKGPQNKTISTTCHGNGNQCNYVSLGKFTTPGDYTIQAYWGGNNVFTSKYSNTLTFRVYQVFGCNPSLTSKTMSVGPAVTNSGTKTWYGNATNATIVRSGDSIPVDYPTISQSDFVGVVDWRTPPPGRYQFEGRTYLTTGSNPSGAEEVRLYSNPSKTPEYPRGTTQTNPRNAAFGEGANYFMNGAEPADINNWVSFYWPSAIIDGNRQNVRLEREIGVYAYAFRPGATGGLPDFDLHVCTGGKTVKSAPLYIINSQLSQ